MAFCSECGAELTPGAKFCGNCGASMIDGATSPRSTVETPVTPQANRIDPQPVIVPSRSGIGLILPIMVLIAVCAIGYLLLGPRSPQPVAANASQTDAVRTASSDSLTSRARAVDDASAAADVASSRTLGSPTTVSAATLDADFVSDPAAARLRYPGPVRVSAVIATTAQPGSTPSLSLQGRTRFNFMVANFPDDYRVRLAPLMKGQAIDVTCGDVRLIGGTTFLSNCLLT